jgi:AcrR family transcriptional regulator
VPKVSRKKGSDARERLLCAAYQLFSAQGVEQVGVDTIVARSGCAKASLYAHFPSKSDLAIAFLDRREAVWTRGWLEAEVHRRGKTPEARLLAIFDVFDGWFQKASFEGCSFINVLLETGAKSPVRRAAAQHLANIRGIVRGLARDARLADTTRFADAWHMLMKGCIVAAGEGNRQAARTAKRAARLVLDGWPRR